MALAGLLGVGVAVGLLRAQLTYSAATTKARQAFTVAAGSLAAVVLGAIQRDQDYMATQQALFEEYPNLTNRQYFRWSTTVDVAARYPGGLGFGFVERVPRAAVPAFRREVLADPVVGEPEPKVSSVFPAGKRPYYCLMRIAYGERLVTPSNIGTVMSFDFCYVSPISPTAKVLPVARDRGSLVVAPPLSIYPGDFFLVEPVYAGGSTPATVAARRAALTGWVLGTISADELVRSLSKGEKGFAIRLTYHRAGQPVLTLGSFSSAGPGGYRLMRQAPAGSGAYWEVSVTGGSGSDAAGEALLVGVLLIGITVLVVLIFWLLLRARRQALVLVDKRTGELRHQALHDSLTGLPNRLLIVDRAEHMLARARREDVVTGILFVDLDNFKDINDSFGHQQGDLLLQEVAQRLVAAVRPGDSVGRLGGDEFVVLVEDGSLAVGPGLVAERVLAVLAEPFVLPGLEEMKLSVRASIGVAVGARASAEELLRDADVALYQAKQSGGGRFVVFRQEMQLAVQERLGLEMDLRGALEEGQLYLDYQPIFDLRSLVMTGVEALLRWRHPRRGIVAPDTFIPLAERTGLILPIGRFVLQESCRQAARWARAGHTVAVSVNISGHQLESDDLPADVQLALTCSGLSPELLTLELTETVLMRDTEAARSRLRVLKDLAVRIAIDDFGTGYSSLGYISQFPIDSLKIDRSFIAMVARSPQARALLRTLVQLGKSLGIDTLAEGIEDERQLAELRLDECDHGQGYLYSRPVSPEAISELLARGVPIEVERAQPLTAGRLA